MALKSVDNQYDEVIDKGEQIQRLLYRILPFWPLIILALLFAYVGGRIYLRYQLPVYSSRARVIVNDQTEQKTANLQEILKLDTRNLTSETEKEIQILSSKDLIARVAAKLQLNTTYSQQGRILSKQFYGEDLPFHLEIANPDSVKYTITGKARLKNDSLINFNDETFKIDSTSNSVYGNITWRLDKNYARNPRKNEEFIITISPLVSTVYVIKSGLQIDPISKQSSILDVSYADQIPERGVQLLNTLINIYGTSAVDYKSKIYENTQQFLDKRLNIVADELNGVEKNLQNFKSSEGIVDLGKEGELYLERVKDADRKMAEIDVQLDIINQVATYVSKRNTSNDQVPATLGVEDPVLTSLLSQLYQTEAELEKVRELSGNKNPQIEVLEGVVAKLKPGILASVNNLKMNLQATKSRLQSDNNRMTGLLNKIPMKERLLLDISRQQEIKNAIYTFLLQKREESAIAAASIVPNYRLIEKPAKAGIISPKPLKIYLTATLIALGLLAIFIYLKEFSSRKILFRAQIEEVLPMPVISELIYHDHNLANPVVVGEGKRTLIAEQFRELRTNINYITAAAKGKCKVILTTSSIPKEGKSFVAINAAISLSLTGDRVLLIEFDMRKPKISKPLGINSDPGLSNFFVNSATEADIIKPHSSIKNLFVIPSGPIPPNPAELMTTAKLNQLFDSLREQFDYIVIDSPPIAAVTDAKILSPLADATLYIIRHNYTNSVFINLLHDVYQKNSLKNINIVFNGIKNKKILGYGYSSYGYGYGYGYSYGYGYTVDDKNKSGFRNLLDKLTFGIFKKRERS